MTIAAYSALTLTPARLKLKAASLLTWFFLAWSPLMISHCNRYIPNCFTMTTFLHQIWSNQKINNKDHFIKSNLFDHFQIWSVSDLLHLINQIWSVPNLIEFDQKVTLHQVWSVWSTNLFLQISIVFNQQYNLSSICLFSQVLTL